MANRKTDAAVPEVVGWLSTMVDAMVDLLRRLVEVESPSSDTAACRACAELLASAGKDILGVAAETVVTGDRVHLHWRTGGDARVALLGHFDTVWPVGTLAARPFTLRGDQAFGPGAFDMKAGVVQGLFALAALGVPDGVEVLLTSDEELGSPDSRALIEDLGRRVEAVLVLEPSADGALKVARKGVSNYRLEVTGRPAHAGLEPEKGVNALSELARLIPQVEALADTSQGTTITPTMAASGIATNMVPPSASAEIDVRALTVMEQTRVDEAMRALRPSIDGARLLVEGGPNRPPLEAALTAALFERTSILAAANGLGTLSAATAGGGSDGNLTAALGTPTLDGLGAVGDGAHAEHEHVLVSQMAPRAALVALLVRDLLTAGGESKR
ncbi:MAG: M20 family metallopeptidase [Candidatus Dormiibacterota bacterium]